MVPQSDSDGEPSEEGADGADLGAVADRLSKYVERPSADTGDQGPDDESNSDGESDDAADGRSEESAEGGTTRETLVVKSAVRERFEEMRVASDFYDALNRRVIDVVEGAAARARENGRKTVQRRDL